MASGAAVLVSAFRDRAATAVGNSGGSFVGLRRKCFNRSLAMRGVGCAAPVQWAA